MIYIHITGMVHVDHLRPMVLNAFFNLLDEV